MDIDKIIKTVKNLPSSAAPFLSFDYKEVERFTSVYDNVNPQLYDYFYIGSDGEGSPICINSINDGVYILDHEFDFKPSFMNSNIQKLEKFVQIYEKHINQICENYGEDAFFDGKYPANEIENLKIKFSLIDPEAVIEPAFWGTVLEVDLSMLT